MARNLLVLNGPNLNLLGTRNPEVYGTTTMLELQDQFRIHANNMRREGKADGNIMWRQSNHEGELIDLLHAARERRANKTFLYPVHDIIFNPGGYAHTSIAIRDAIECLNPGEYPIRIVEVHISDIMQREPFRRVMMTGEVCDAIISGCGPDGYLHALERLHELEKSA